MPEREKRNLCTSNLCFYNLGQDESSDTSSVEFRLQNADSSQERKID